VYLLVLLIPIGPQKCILDDLLRVGRGAHDAHRQAQHLAGVLTHNLVPIHCATACQGPGKPPVGVSILHDELA
jgi:hypothetical protein